MRVRDIMSTRVVTTGREESASVAWRRMRRRNIRHLVVLDDTTLVGVLSERDLGGRRGAEVREDRLVRDLMTSRVASTEPETTVREAADLMRERLVGSLAVMDGDRLVGIVTATDVFEALGREATGPRSGAERQLLRAPTSSKRLGGQPAVRSRSRVQAETPREGPVARGSQKRAPLADRVPRALKRTAGSTRAPQVPANIRVAGVGLDQNDREYIRDRLGRKLGKYAPSIERVTVRVEDVNGPRGGVDQRCRIKVVLSGLPSVVFESQSASLVASVNNALTGVERAVRRSVERRRTRPTKAAVGAGSGPGG